MVYNNCNTTTSTSVKWQVTIFALPEGVHDRKGMTKGQIGQNGNSELPSGRKALVLQ